jgi:NAD-dependent oxidoreductase involved in siderophore biosynthesis
MRGVLRFLRQASAPRAEAAASDGQLLERFVAGHDEAAFAALVARHGPLVWGVCRRLLHQAPDAEDAFQATFLVLAAKAAAIVKHPGEAVHRLETVLTIATSPPEPRR